MPWQLAHCFSRNGHKLYAHCPVSAPSEAPACQPTAACAKRNRSEIFGLCLGCWPHVGRPIPARRTLADPCCLPRRCTPGLCMVSAAVWGGGGGAVGLDGPVSPPWVAPFCGSWRAWRAIPSHVGVRRAGRRSGPLAAFPHWHELYTLFGVGGAAWPATWVRLPGAVGAAPTAENWHTRGAHPRLAARGSRPRHRRRRGLVRPIASETGITRWRAWWREAGPRGWWWRWWWRQREAGVSWDHQRRGQQSPHLARGSRRCGRMGLRPTAW
jgi:hypothetical protein